MGVSGGVIDAWAGAGWRRTWFPVGEAELAVVYGVDVVDLEMSAVEGIVVGVASFGGHGDVEGLWRLEG